MPIFWLRVALIFYGAGMLYALTALTRRTETAARILMPLTGLGLAFHFVSLTEQAIQLGHFAPATVHQDESLLAFLLLLFFGAIFGPPIDRPAKYAPTSVPITERTIARIARLPNSSRRYQSVLTAKPM